jgi:hypothetical protein
MSGGEAELGGFLKAAGQSLGDAQKDLSGTNVPMGVAISEVELEVKATFEPTESGALSLRPVSSSDTQTVGSDTLSTIRVRYVPVAEDEPAASSSPSEGPQRTADDVIAEVRRRPDISSLERGLGELRFTTTFIPHVRRWLVSVIDDQDNTVREAVVHDPPR